MNAPPFLHVNNSITLITLFQRLYSIKKSLEMYHNLIFQFIYQFEKFESESMHTWSQWVLLFFVYGWKREKIGNETWKKGRMWIWYMSVCVCVCVWFSRLLLCRPLSLKKGNNWYKKRCKGADGSIFFWGWICRHRSVFRWIYPSVFELVYFLWLILKDFKWTVVKVYIF